MRIEFTGLGIIGKPMVRNLLKAGYELIVYDVVRFSMDEVIKGGAKAASPFKDVAAQCSLIITMLPNSPHVKSMVLGTDGVLEGAAPGTILADMSSVAPLAFQEVCRKYEKKGVKMTDASMSGGEPKAIDGTPSIMTDGEEEVSEQVYDALMTMGASAIHRGDIGAEDTAKLANQIIVALNITAASGALMLSTRVGVDPLKVFDAIKDDLAGSMVMNAKVPTTTGGNFTPGFKIDLRIKDLGNVLETGHRVSALFPLTVQVMEIMQNLHVDGLGENDHSAIVRYYEKLTGIEIRKQECL